jgi:hypothetical protein
MIGRLYYKFHVKFGHGLRTAWYRDRVRWRILESPPVTAEPDRACEIHVLTSARDWVNLMWVLKSFYRHSGRSFALCIHEDGSLCDEERQTLQRHFPHARLIPRAFANQRMEKVLAEFPRCREFRDRNPLSLKVFDFAEFLENERMFLLDSDILFYAPPAELTRRIEDPGYGLNTLNKDWTFGYTVKPEDVRAQIGFDLPPLINSGLGLIHRGTVRPELCEEYLALPNFHSHNHRIEQTLIALCCVRAGFEFLPEEYDVLVATRLPETPSRHYVGEIRHRLYREGVPRLIRSGLLNGRTVH